MVVFRGIEVKVRVNGEDAVEYDDPEPQGNAPLAQKTVIKYIESIDDAEFEIYSKVLPEFVYDTAGIDFELRMDGRWECAIISRETNNYPGRPIILMGNTERSYDGTRTLRKFKFSSIKIVEGADYEKIKEDVKAAEKLGELEVNVRRITSMKVDNNIRPQPNKQSNKELDIAEKALKGRALTHGASYAQGVRVADKESLQVKFFENDKTDPFMRFVFRYRSKAALRSEMIIPREPTPDQEHAPARILAPPRPSQVNVDDLSIEELRELARTQAAQLENSQRRGSGQPEGDIKPEPFIKPERGIKRERVKDPVVTIDLEAPPKKHRKTSMQDPLHLTSDSD